MGLAAVMIIVAAVTRGQSFLKTLPTLVTLLVQILMARANRYGFLVGGFNAALYGAGYWMEGLYFSAASSLLFSFPMQIWSFFHWKKNSQGDKVSFRRFRWWHWGLTLLSVGGGWWICMRFLRPLFTDAVWPELDALLFLLGIVVTVLMAVPYPEAQYLGLVSSAGNLVLWVFLAWEDPADLTYLFISIYNFYRTVQAAVVWTVQSRKQKNAISSEV